MSELEGKKILVVGAAGGMGLPTVQVCLEHGAQVVAADIVTPTGTGAALELRCDVTDADSVAQTVAQAEEAMGGLTGLAYVTGVNHAALPIAQFPMAEWERVFDVNVKGVVRMAHSVVPALERNGGGSIVTVSSWWSHAGHAYFAAYCASKFALVALTQSMAEELAQSNIRVNSVAPGNMDTKMHTDALLSEAEKRGISFEEMRDIEWAKIPMGYAGPPRSVSEAIAFLLSDRSSYTTGARLDVNGGVSFG
jgi:NAD(P)-dependent dehydrogenase (short-subunit alcohol dehydrogenase family)